MACDSGSMEPEAQIADMNVSSKT